MIVQDLGHTAMTAERHDAGLCRSRKQLLVTTYLPGQASVLSPAFELPMSKQAQAERTLAKLEGT